MLRKPLLLTGVVSFVLVILFSISDLKRPADVTQEFKSEESIPPVEDHTVHHHTKTYSPGAYTQVTTIEGVSSLEKARLTRLGSQLAFDSSTCPGDSLLRNGTLENYWRARTHPKCPEVFIIGAKKGGTTSLYNYTSHHPDFEGIRLTNVSRWFGETHFFAKYWGELPLSEYLVQFPADKMSGDASVDNLVHCQAPKRIFTTCGPDTKVIVLLRDPVERYVSNFQMRISRNGYINYNPNTSIATATKKEVRKLFRRVKRVLDVPLHNLGLKSDWSKLVCLFACCDSMIYEGMYYIFIMNWLCNFPSENLMIINSEEMFVHPVPVLKQVFNFVGLRPLSNKAMRRITSFISNKTPRSVLPRHQLSTRDRTQLLNMYRPFDKELLALLSWPDSLWSTE